MKLLAVLVFMATPAFAQEGPVYDAKLLPACLDRAAGDASALHLCIGKAADACMAGPGGSTTVGMVACLMQETRDWDRLLNAYYSKAMAAAEQADAEMAEIGSAAEPAAPVLKQAQRNWIAFRDASCRYQVLRFYGGTAGGPAASACMMELTAEQALRLRALTEWDE